ncbi:hypothetical protein P4661_28995 [Priestia megaterium]|uniref:hypothetical protein n=1 Tax=Priestia megaterium TaxID=1404 RepID=UPI001EDA416F|nr:hypothetical protein [Priestia megaterium]MDH3161287.1 hypothetical protein [Priestia megaterium]MED4116873.1 hypothetical protein [Priestia megaterium]UKJ83820.1 hypothetical protein H1W83_29575 [Priestia megaterium]
MQIFATFEHSTNIELAISELEQKGINDLFAVPLDNRTEERKLFDTIHRSDGVSLSQTGLFLSVIFSTIGASRGFILEWGPIYWGLIGAFFGFVLGFLFDLFVQKRVKKKQRVLRGKASEVIVIVQCEENQKEQVEHILWGHLALGVAITA